jgi:hypothetical protein
MSAREDIAQALNDSGLGLNVTAYYRQSLKPFDGFVKWGGTTQASNKFGWVNSWQVWLALQQDVKASEQWLETNLSALVEAFDAEVVVTSANPAELIVGDGASVNGLILEGSLSASM